VLAAERPGADTAHWVAVENSVAGRTAAMAAGAFTVALPKEPDDGSECAELLLRNHEDLPSLLPSRFSSESQAPWGQEGDDARMSTGLGALHLLEELEAERLAAIPGGEVFAYSARCPGKTRTNEDGAAVLPCGDSLLLVVADGLGGQPGADQASGIAIRALARGAQSVAAKGLAVHDTVLSSLEEANREIIALDVGAGTTIALAEVSAGVMRPYHVGDSSVMISSRTGDVRAITIPHSPIGYALAAGLLDEEEALHHPDRHIISNMVGSSEMRVEVGSPVTLEKGDTLLVASDGVTDNLRLAELVELLSGDTLGEVGPAVIGACRARMLHFDPSGDAPSKPDDLTCLLYRASSGG
jgi:serine/threonine protein phosphatase PrpC